MCCTGIHGLDERALDIQRRAQDKDRPSCLLPGRAAAALHETLLVCRRHRARSLYGQREHAHRRLAVQPKGTRDRDRPALLRDRGAPDR